MQSEPSQAPARRAGSARGAEPAQM